MRPLVTVVWVVLAALCVGPAASARSPGAESLLALDGTWDVVLDPQADGVARGLPSGAGAGWRAPLAVAVPGALEVHPKAVGYDGVSWYRRRIPPVASPAPDAGRLWLAFDSVDARADVWLDGRSLGRHDGSDVPFRFDVTGRLDAGGVLVVRVVDPGDRQVDGLVLGAMPHAKESWYFNYGGLLGAVRIERAPLVECVGVDCTLDDTGRPVALLDLFASGEAARTLACEVSLLADASSSAACTWRGTLDAGPGRTRVRLPLDGDASALPHWSPDAPRRVLLRVTRADAAPVEQRVGLRTFRVVGDHFELDGQPIALRGVLFQPYWPLQLCKPPDAGFLRRELQAIKDAGFDLVRAHLRAMPELYELCDEIGLLVHAEPTLGWITVPREETLPLVDDALVALADAVAAHPSVVLVGVLNEMSGEIFPHTAELHRRMAELLPDHVVLDDSGSWQGSAHYLQPGCDAPVEYDDLHVYRAWPWEQKDFDFAASLGRDDDGVDTGRLVYVSEYGYGGMPSLRDAVTGFGARLDVEDAQQALEDMQAAQRLLSSGRIQRLARSLEDLSALGQLDQARAAAVMSDALRRNPRVAGDVYTQWRDAAWENGAGLVDTWARPKPALAALAERNRAAIAHGSDLPPLPVAPELPDRAPKVVASGGLIALDASQQAVVSQIVAPPTPDSAGLPRLVVLGRRAAMWAPENVGITTAVLSWVRDGGTALFVDAPDAGQPFDTFFFGYDGLGQVSDLPLDLRAAAARGHFVGTHLAVPAGSLLLSDVPGAGPLLDERFGALRPHVVLLPGDGVECSLELVCLDGYGALRGAAVGAYTYGKGRLVLSTLRLDEEQLDDPLARRLLENLVRYAARVASGLPEPPAVRDATPPAEDQEALGRALWRHKIWFGLAERLTTQSFNGERPVRDPPPRLAETVWRKVAGLDAVLSGRSADGLALLGRVDSEVLTGETETFLRNELELARAFSRPVGEAPVPRSLAETLAVGRHHARALRLQRLGEHAAALGELRAASDLVQRLDAGGELVPSDLDDDPDADGIVVDPPDRLDAASRADALPDDGR